MFLGSPPIFFFSINNYYVRGMLKIAEVVSRFPDVKRFIQALEKIGFKFISKVRFCYLF